MYEFMVEKLIIATDREYNFTNIVILFACYSICLTPPSA